MKVQAFIEKVKNEGVDNLKEMLEIRDYARFDEKYDLCSSVIDECNDVDAQTGIVSVDSVMRHVVFTITVISLYTNLEFSYGEKSEMTSIDEYNMLCENKLLKSIINEFADEYVECEQILETMQNDLIANNNNVYHVIGNVAKQLLNVVEPLADVLTHKASELNLDLSQDNIDKYMKLLEKISAKE